ncbi:MAG: tRNA (adenosine(37)-N6)-threonylcarbamoyltransferase complex ATPase subunit type 1 TsaE [Bacteroidales bacterium]|nr:tRNA (adenosine(37)-N6)-threonylcarbamoyltransferase complex ATPase subunit type 1 TsaE [Bacteroidales bacterium]
MLPKDFYACSQEEELFDVAKKLFQKFPTQRIFALHGAMGVGKTTFIKYICRYLQSEDTVNSPTFSMVNEYALPFNKTLYHFDFYRIKSIDEALDMGFEDYLYSNQYCFIEWAEKVEALLPPETIHVTMFIKDEDKERVIVF